MLMWWWRLPISYIGPVIIWTEISRKSQFREMCGRGRVTEGGISRKFEEGLVMVFMTNHFNEKRKRIGLSF